jgi:hypothetical protein
MSDSKFLYFLLWLSLNNEKADWINRNNHPYFHILRVFALNHCREIGISRQLIKFEYYYL